MGRRQVHKQFERNLIFSFVVDLVSVTKRTSGNPSNCAERLDFAGRGSGPGRTPATCGRKA